MGRHSDPRKAAAWERRLAGCGESGLTVGRFCDREGVSIATFHYWQRNLRYVSVNETGWALLGESAEADRLADLLLARHLLPSKAAADAQHVALAATAGVDYLLTWKCKHIANADLLPALYETLRAEGFLPPLIVTPEEFSDAG